MNRSFLVTGGAGYVGSHLVAALVARGDQVVVVDNLRQGHRAAVPETVQVLPIDVGDIVAMDAVLARQRFDAVFHFAALSLVGESMREPFRYLIENGVNGVRLIEACVRHGVTRFVLSSTAALFGLPDVVPIPDDARIDPGSPYGESKLMIERALLWADRLCGMRSACLRYFNAAGAAPDGSLGEDHDPESHLIPLVIDAALGRRDAVAVFGTDYETPDGTCIRDYVHVSDLADAHLRALDLLAHGSVRHNLGIGQGRSVLEVIRSVERVCGRRVPHRFAERRPGDPAVLVAASDAFRHASGWSPRFVELDDIVRTAYRWREAHPDGYGD